MRRFATTRAKAVVFWVFGRTARPRRAQMKDHDVVGSSQKNRHAVAALSRATGFPTPRLLDDELRDNLATSPLSDGKAAGALIRRSVWLTIRAARLNTA